MKQSDSNSDEHSQSTASNDRRGHLHKVVVVIIIIVLIAGVLFMLASDNDDQDDKKLLDSNEEITLGMYFNADGSDQLSLVDSYLENQQITLGVSKQNQDISGSVMLSVTDNTNRTVFAIDNIELRSDIEYVDLGRLGVGEYTATVRQDDKDIDLLSLDFEVKPSGQESTENKVQVDDQTGTVENGIQKKEE